MACPLHIAVCEVEAICSAGEAFSHESRLPLRTTRAEQSTAGVPPLTTRNCAALGGWWEAHLLFDKKRSRRPARREVSLVKGHRQGGTAHCLSPHLHPLPPPRSRSHPVGLRPVQTCLASWTATICSQAKSSQQNEATAGPELAEPIPLPLTNPSAQRQRLDVARNASDNDPTTALQKSHVFKFTS